MVGAPMSTSRTRVLAALASSLATGLAGVLAIAWAWVVMSPVVVIDGDTVDRGPLRYRLADMDAPEIRRARCPAEREAGRAAKARLAAIVAGAQRVELLPVKARDPWGRVIARLEVDGRDVAVTAIAEGWGVAYHGRGARKVWCEG